MPHPIPLLLPLVTFGLLCMAQAPRTPDLEAQRAAMKKLAFLTGHWSGEASALRAPGQTVQMDQTEEAQFKLDGLLLSIEGIGRTKPDGKVALQALGLISFDDALGTYHMRAFNDGRWLETEVTLGDDGNSISWGFTFGEIKTKSVLRIDDKGEWTEEAEITLPGKPPHRLMQLTVRRIQGKQPA